MLETNYDLTSKMKNLTSEQYELLYQKSIDNPETFWTEMAQGISWSRPFSKVKNARFESPVHIKWFEDGQLNACYNCIDRHLPTRKDQTALIWEGDDPQLSKKISYQELYERVSEFGNILRKLGVQKGDRVTIYLPMIPEAIYSMLACARVGAIHSVVFGGFSAESLKDRINDCESKLLITADYGVRGGKLIPLKQNANEALEHTPCIESVLVVKTNHVASAPLVNMQSGRDVWLHEEVVSVKGQECVCEIMSAEDPLFILYTSGSTGKPKGVLHTTGGYMVHVYTTFKYVFDYQPGEVYWCTADVGWVTGHSYIVYGPLAYGATSLIFEGVPHYPDFSRFWQVIDKHQVNIFYTAPTAIRALMREGENFVKKTKRSSLRLLGSVGEPINSEAWEWYFHTIGEGRCPIVDTWWQTETGGIMITPLPSAMRLKPGSASKPFFGVKPVIVDQQGQILEGPCEGFLCIAQSWPGQMRTVYKNHERFEQTYFSNYKGLYFTGDGVKRDEDGYYWITGRVDDVINVSGHRLGTAEIESALDLHPKVAEAAVVGFPHDIKGQGIYAYVTLYRDVAPDHKIEQELIELVKKEIGAIAKPDIIQWVSGLPKTRSGKIMRRILRKVAAKEFDSLGDITTLADPSVVEELIKVRMSQLL